MPYHLLQVQFQKEPKECMIKTMATTKGQGEHNNDHKQVKSMEDNKVDPAFND